MTQLLPGPPPPPPPPPPAAPRTLSAENRRAACTHTKVTRLFDNYGSHKCAICHRHPSIGWIYRCTEDYDGFLPESEFADTMGRFSTGSIAINTPVEGQLSDWIVKAIEGGHYTPQEVETLKAQKLKVQETIKKCEPWRNSSKPATNQSVSSKRTEAVDASDEAKSQEPIILPSLRLNPYLPVIDEDEEHEDTPIPESAVTILEPDSKQPFFPACRYRCCATCRPAYRERAWGSIDTMCQDVTKPVPIWELLNRPVSDAETVSKLGLPRLRHAHRTLDHDMGITYSEESDDVIKDGLVQDTDADDMGLPGAERERTRGFRASIRRAFRGVFPSDRSDSRSTKQSKRSSKGMRGHTRQQEEDSEDYDIGLWRD